MTRNIYSADEIANTMEALAFLGFNSASYKLITDSEGGYYKIVAESTVWESDKKSRIGFGRKEEVTK